MKPSTPHVELAPHLIRNFATKLQKGLLFGMTLLLKIG
jgi:hypothetical protein